jgi:hypothetical protein
MDGKRVFRKLNSIIHSFVLEPFFADKQLQCRGRGPFKREKKKLAFSIDHKSSSFSKATFNLFHFAALSSIVVIFLLPFWLQ